MISPKHTITIEDRLLEYLEKNKGKNLSKEQIFNEIWGNRKHSDYFKTLKDKSRTLDVHICKLRKKGHKIATIFGYGYKIVD